MCLSHLTVLEMVVPRNLNDSSTYTGWPLISGGMSVWGCRQNLIFISRFLAALRSQALLSTPSHKMLDLLMKAGLVIVRVDVHYSCIIC